MLHGYAIVQRHKVEQAHIDYLQALTSHKLTVQGIYDGEIYVVTDQEQERTT